MALKKDYRKDNTYMIITDSNPKLGAKVLSDGRESLFLDYYFGYQMVYNERLDKQVARKDRKREYLSLYLLHNPKSPLERQQNKETLDLAKKLRFERGQELLENKESYRLKKNQDVNFLDFFKNYLDNYTKKDKRNVKIAFNRFIDFLNATPEYQKFSKILKPGQISKDMVETFTEYLQSRSKGGEGARTIYARFKKVIKYAVEHDILRKNPCTGISIKVDDNILRKDILSQEEIKTLIATHYEHENPTIRRSFIFALYTGLRFCDIKELRFWNVDASRKVLSFEQNKTKGHSSSSGVVIPLRDDLLKLIGEPENDSDRDELIFKLPSHTMCNKALKHWVKRAGINKKITWHCARHSFGTNLLVNGANIKTVATLLGHSGLRHVEKYVRSVDSLKQAAINSLPDLPELDI